MHVLSMKFLFVLSEVKIYFFCICVVCVCVGERGQGGGGVKVRHHKYPKYMFLEELKYNVLALFWINCHLFSEGFVLVILTNLSLCQVSI